MVVTEEPPHERPQAAAATCGVDGSGRPESSRRGRWVPPQHGAWAMLLVPFAAGLLSWGGRTSWWHLPLLTAWLAGYLLSYYALLAVKTRRLDRVRDQLADYGGVTLVCGLAVVLARPPLLRLAPAFAVLVGVNLWYAHRRRERALLNDLASVVQACLMTFAVAIVAQVPLRPMVGPALACLLYFTGTVLYVKTMIRERGEPGYLRASTALHALALPLATAVSMWLFVPFTGYLFRAVLLPHRSVGVRTVGLVEVACSVALLLALALPPIGLLPLGS